MVSSAPRSSGVVKTAAARVCRGSWLGVALGTLAGLSACGQGSVATPAAHYSGTKTTFAHASGHLTPTDAYSITLKKVRLHVGTEWVTATFWTYDPISKSTMSAPSCGNVGISLHEQNLAFTASSADRESEREYVPQDDVQVTFLADNEIELRVLRSRLGEGFSPDETWNAFAFGPTCPPANQSLDLLSPDVSDSPTSGR